MGNRITGEYHPFLYNPSLEEHKPTDFGVTVEEFIENYETALNVLGYELWQLSPPEERQIIYRLSVQVQLDKFRVLVITANSSNRSVRAVTFFGGGQGQSSDDVAIAVGAFAMGMALENPTMTPENRDVLGKDLGILDGNILDIANDEKIDIERNGVKYYVSPWKGIGIMIAAEPSG